MAKEQTKLYVTAYFSTEGRFEHFSLSQYKPANEMNEYGLTVLVREIVYEYAVPDDIREVNILAAGALEAFILKEKGAHQMRMMKMETALNSMRGIGYTEVLDAEPRPWRLPPGDQIGEVDDIPL